MNAQPEVSHRIAVNPEINQRKFLPQTRVAYMDTRILSSGRPTRESATSATLNTRTYNRVIDKMRAVTVELEPSHFEPSLN